MPVVSSLQNTVFIIGFLTLKAKIRNSEVCIVGQSPHLTSCDAGDVRLLTDNFSCISVYTDYIRFVLLCCFYSQSMGCIEFERMFIHKYSFGLGMMFYSVRSII